MQLAQGAEGGGADGVGPPAPLQDGLQGLFGGLAPEAPEGGDYADSVQAVLKLRGTVEIVAEGSLPKDGVLIEDQRSYD